MGSGQGHEGRVVATDPSTNCIECACVRVGEFKSGFSPLVETIYPGLYEESPEVAGYLVGDFADYFAGDFVGYFDGYIIGYLGGYCVGYFVVYSVGYFVGYVVVYVVGYQK